MAQAVERGPDGGHRELRRTFGDARDDIAIESTNDADPPERFLLDPSLTRSIERKQRDPGLTLLEDCLDTGYGAFECID